MPEPSADLERGGIERPKVGEHGLPDEYSRLQVPPAGNDGTLTIERQIAGTFHNGLSALNSGMVPESRVIFKRLSTELGSALSAAYESGGLDKLTQTINAVDASIDGKGVGLHGRIHGDNVKVYALRPVDVGIANVLDKAGINNDSFLKLKGQWYETLATTSVDLSKLDQNAQKVSDYERIEGRPIEQKAKALADQVSKDIAKFKGQGVSKSLIDALATATSRSEGAPDLQIAINNSLKGTGYSVELSYRYGLTGMHGDTVVETIVSVNSGDRTIARQLEQHDTVRSFGSGKGLKSERSGVITEAQVSPSAAARPRENLIQAEDVPLMTSLGTEVDAATTESTRARASSVKLESLPKERTTEIKSETAAPKPDHVGRAMGLLVGTGAASLYLYNLLASNPNARNAQSDQQAVISPKE